MIGVALHLRLYVRCGLVVYICLSETSKEDTDMVRDVREIDAWLFGVCSALALRDAGTMLPRLAGDVDPPSVATMVGFMITDLDIGIVSCSHSSSSSLGSVGLESTWLKTGDLR